MAHRDQWAQRYREHGAAGMHDRSSRPHRQPNATPAPVVRKILHLRRKRRLGPRRETEASPRRRPS
ncbi:leucine zipper domain-containing protein [Actinoplanes sp. NPDC049668]|uniref:leucine zipper domain-containing protein n=1 Tax=Actinoplanes sp. NPDC049668 TaxID=3363904 RepID=UPI00378A7316